VVVLNGEIYNYRELRAELQARGHILRTQGDTEVIAHLYEEYGTRCVERLDGMFAFALWDDARGRMLLGRDRVGKKPLFYALRGGTLSFASELHALLQDPEIPRDVDPRALDLFLTFGYVPAPLSALTAVRKLPPAHILTVGFDQPLATRRYWELDYSRKLDAPVNEICERVRDSLRTATRRRLVSDVPVGAFLSGGIDSSAVVAAMAEASAQPVRTFSIDFDHERFDELPVARRIAQQFGTVHEEFRVRADAVEILPEIVRHHGEPFADASAIPSFYLARLTRRRVTVALNGDGGDESFAGYTRYVANAVAARLDRLPAPLRSALADAGARLPGRGDVGSVANKARRLAVGLALDEAQRYARYVSLFGPAERSALYGSDLCAALVALPPAEAMVTDAFAACSGASVVDRMLEVDVRTYLPGDLLTKIDIATMASSLEARSPFLDHELMELAASIPAKLKVRGREKKWILRRALRGLLPDDVLDRPKQGFSVPLSAWLGGDLRGWAHEILLDRATLDRGYFDPHAVRALLDRHAAGTEADAKRIWALVMFELWHREVIDAPRATMAAAA